MTANRFDLVASEWDTVPDRRNIAQKTAEAILVENIAQPHMKALDFGSGTGLLTVLLQRHLREVVALDSSRGMLEQLRTKIEAHQLNNVHTEFLDIEGDTRNFVAQHKHSFDFIFSSMVLHHIEDTAELFQLFRKICSDQAVLALADLDKEDGTFHKDNAEAGVKHFGFDRARLKEIIQNAGWNDVRFETVHTVQRAESGRDYPIFLCIAR